MKPHSKLVYLAVVLATLASLEALVSCKKTRHDLSANLADPPATPTQTTVPVTPTAAPIPTVYPSSSYLPAYPGSYWIYTVNGGISQQTISTGSSYIHDSVNIASYWSEPKYQHAMVPVYDGKPLWGLKRHEYSNEALKAILKDSAIKVGDVLSVWGSGSTGGTDSYRIILSKDTSYQVGSTMYSPVIVTRDYDKSYGGKIFIGTDCYYAKDIGLVARLSYQMGVYQNSHLNPLDRLPPDSIKYKMELSLYFINK